MRRILLAATAAIGLAALAVAGVVLTRSDGDSARSVVSTTTGGSTVSGPAVGPEVPDAPSAGTTTTSAVVSSAGATPASGALVSGRPRGGPLAATGPGGCRVDGTAALDCAVAEGEGGRFGVAVVGTASAFDVRLYGGVGLEPVAASEVFDGVEVVGVTVAERSAGGEPVIVVDYDFGGSGSVHSFDVVAWADDGTSPRVVAFVDGQGLDRVRQAGEAIEFVSADYSDGSPTCCPERALVRRLVRDDASWRLTAETRPFDEV